jgi:hypothetical protein
VPQAGHETVRTLADFPVDYAQTQNNLAATYQQRIAGVRRDNLEATIRHYEEALTVRTLADFPIDFRATQVNLAWLAFDALADEAERVGDAAARLRAYTLADAAYQPARAAQVELGWLEGDEQGKAQLLGQHQALREMYARHAYVLWQLGNLKEAIRALDAGRAQALAESQTLRSVSLPGLSPEDAAAFAAARTAWEQARAQGDLPLARAARQRLLAMREQIRSQPGHEDFLPGEPTYQQITAAPAHDQALIYLAATDKGGLAFMLPPARAGAPRGQPLALDLPALTWDLVGDWLVRPDEERRVVGGLRLALDWQALPLLGSWLVQMDEPEQMQVRATPLRAAADALPEPLGTLARRAAPTGPHLGKDRTTVGV